LNDAVDYAKAASELHEQQVQRPDLAAQTAGAIIALPHARAACSSVPSKAGLETWQSSLTTGGVAMVRYVCSRACTASLWGSLALCCSLLAPAAFADPEGPRDTPAEFTRMACYDLVQHEGRMIAWGRWEQGFSQERMRSAPFAPNTPEWMVSMVQRWIADAYSWQVTDEQVYQWAAELGNTSDLPQASSLSQHQTIAIWMRRIARECAQQPT
jgi:hypothetical protein